MSKFVIVFERPIRLGLDIVECVGPFNEVQEAIDWLKSPFAIELPYSVIMTLGANDTLGGVDG